MGEALGVMAAVLSSALGGTAIGATRYLAGVCDPLALGAFRFGLGFAFLLPLALLQKSPWPARRDWPKVAGLGLLFFAAFPILFNASLMFTTAARGALALSTLPVLTMAVAATLGIEPLTRRKSLGVLMATGGVAMALLAGLTLAPDGAWRGDLLMFGASLCMAFYNVWSRPLIRRASPLRFTALAMLVGAVFLILVSWVQESFSAVAAFGAPQWWAIGYLGLFGGAITFFLWAFALGRTTPTKVAIAVTVNPVTASLFGAALLGEPIRWNLAFGLVMVFAGIWTATTAEERRRGVQSP